LNPQLLSEIVALILQLGPLAVDLVVKLEGLLNLGPDEKANIANAIAASNKADQDTMNKVAAWMSANGFKTQVSFIKA
jgi:L-cysteine desulfidase